MLENMHAEVPEQPDNPGNSERHAMARAALAQQGRLDDFEYILKYMAPPPDITTLAGAGVFKNVKVGIIGGGLSGMAAAFELRKLGFDITVFEAEEKRIGGRVYTYYFDSDKTLYGEFGAMRMPVIHETLWHYLNLFKLKTRPFIQTNPNALIYLKNVRVRNDPSGRNVMQYIYPRYPLRPWERGMSWEELAYRGLQGALLGASPQVRSEILQIKRVYHPFTRYWDGNDIRRIMEAAGLSQGAIDLVGNFFPLAGQDLYNSYIDYVQELYSVDLSYLYEIPGGTVKLPLAFYNSLKSSKPAEDYPDIPARLLGAVTWKDGYWVEGIYFDGNSDKVVLAYNHKGNHGRLYEHFDYVVCAIPFSTLRTMDICPLFSNIKMQAIREVNYTNAQKTAMLCRQRFWEQGGPGMQIIGGASYTDLPISQIYYPSVRAGYQNPGVLLASYNFNLDATRLAHMPAEFRSHQIKHEVARAHGLPGDYLDAIAADLKTVNWNDEKWFRGALCFYTPQQKSLFSYGAALPEYGGRVFFAGEHISAKHRWMQGALRSGMEAANHLAEAGRTHG